MTEPHIISAQQIESFFPGLPADQHDLARRALLIGMRLNVPPAPQKTQYDGLLFIGDPHLTSRRPGRRTDANHAMVILDKLDQAFKIARERNLLVVILGDLFSQSKESCHWLLAYLNKLLAAHAKATPHAVKALCLAGNHDMKDTKLTDDTALGVVATTGLIDVLATTAPIVLAGLCVIYPIPSGFPVPDAVEVVGGLPSIVLTHDDFAFGGGYPGAKPLKEIAGATMQVNGHMHKTERLVRVGKTMCHCPGNIIRVSIDTKDHIPSVWEWRPDFGQDIVQIPLVYSEDVFDNTGKQVAANIEAITDDSQFVEMLVAECATDMARTDTGDVLSHELHAIMDATVFERPDIGVAVRGLIEQMLGEAAAKNATTSAMPELEPA